MPSSADHGLAQRKQRWVDLMDPTKPPSLVYLIDYNPDPAPLPQWCPDRTQERIDWAMREYERQVEQMTWLRDDTIPCLDPRTGTEIIAAAFGCPVSRPDDNMPFARPLISQPSEVGQVPEPTLDAPSLAQLFEIGDALRRRAGPDAVMKLVDVQTPMDNAALIWDKNTFYTGILDAPEAVRALADKVCRLFYAFYDEWFRRYGAEFIAHYPSYYMASGMTVSEDEVGVVSTDMFREFFLPELVEISQRYGRLGMHCCANARHQWAGFKQIPNLCLLNLVHTEDTIRAAWACFADHVAQMHSWSGDGPAWTWPAQYPAGARIALTAHANTRDEALELADRLWVACGHD